MEVAIVTVILTAVIAFIGFTLRRLVTQLDKNTESIAKLGTIITTESERLDRHEAWHMFKGDELGRIKPL